MNKNNNNNNLSFLIATVIYIFLTAMLILHLMPAFWVLLILFVFFDLYFLIKMVCALMLEPLRFDECEKAFIVNLVLEDNFDRVIYDMKNENNNRRRAKDEIENNSRRKNSSRNKPLEITEAVISWEYNENRKKIEELTYNKRLFDRHKFLYFILYCLQL